MEEVCRTCLGIINTDTSPYYEIESNDGPLSPTSNRQRILSVVSEIDLNVSKRSVICNNCHEILDIIFDFRMKCLKTEEAIKRYVQSKAETTDFSLKDVLEANEIQEEQQIPIDMAIVKQECLEEEMANVDMNVTESEANAIVNRKIKEECASESEVGSDTDLSDGDNVDNAEKVEVKVFNEPSGSNQVIFKHKALYTCNLCNAEYSIKKELNVHLREHFKEEQVLECKVCQKKFSRRCYLNYHMTMHTGESRHNCYLCEKKYTRRDILRKHLKKHHNIDIDSPMEKELSLVDDRKYTCDICQREFAQEIFLLHHKATHTEARPYKCDICNSSFKAQNTLTLHKRKHMVSRNIQCEYCNKQFHSVGYLREHLRTHTGEKIFECNMCDQKFALKPSLRKHIFSHYDKKTFKCDTCNRKFYSDEELAAHRSVHNTGKTFSCNMCSKTFGTKNNLKSHMITHSETRPFSCFKCPRAFNRRLGLKHHIMSMHKDIDIKSVVIEKFHTSLMPDAEDEVKME